MITVEEIRKVLDEVLREAESAAHHPVTKVPIEENHPWRPPVTDEYIHNDCAAHNEGLNCCLDYGHGAYNELLDYLAERVASKLMYCGGAVTNVVATSEEELRPPEPVGNGLRKYEEVLTHWPADNLEIRVERSKNARTWVIDSHPKSKGELHEKLKVIHGLREETEYTLVFYDVTSINAVRAVGNVVMQSTL